MTNDNFKQMLGEALEPVNQRLDELTKGQEVFRKELAEIKDTIETRILPPLIYIETTIKGYADMYKKHHSFNVTT